MLMRLQSTADDEKFTRWKIYTSIIVVVDVGTQNRNLVYLWIFSELSPS